jgi:uncharacterized repeat protein (TIGR01451 family)
MSTTSQSKGFAGVWRLALSIALLAMLTLMAPPPQPAYAANGTTITIDSDDPDPSVVGQGYWVHWCVVPVGGSVGDVYGTVTVDDGEGNTCSRTIDSDGWPNGWCWGCTLRTYTVGSKTLTATFVPLDPDLYSGSSDTEPHQVNAADTTTTVTSSPNPSAEGHSVTFTATVSAVSPGGGTPAGTVSFYADGALLGTGTLDGSGVATLSSYVLTPGQHWITAEYSGDANYNGSESLPLAQQVLDADLKIIKMVKPDGEVRAGDTVVYTVMVDNLGPGTAYNLVVDDTMTASGSYTVQSIVPDHGGSCTPATPASSSGTNNQVAIGCTLAELDAHDRWTIVVSAVANQTIDINNVASVYAELPSDPNLENNYVGGAIAVTDVADLSVTKEAKENPYCAHFYEEWDGSSEDIQLDVPCAGRPLDYTLTVMNSGPSTAENVVLEELLPDGVTVASVSPDQGSCTTGIPGDPWAPLVCNLGNLPPDTSTTVELSVEIDQDLPLTECGEFVINGIPVCVAKMENDAVVYSDIFDDNNSNNRAHLALDVYGASGLEVTKSAFPDPVQAGENLDYTVTITNLGPSLAQGVVFTDRLPGDPGDLTFIGFDFLRGNGACTYVASLNAVQCKLDNMPVWDQANPQSEVVLHFITDPGVEDATTWDNCLSRWDDWEASSFIFPTPHDVCAATTVQNVADLAIAKTSEPMKVYPDEQAVYHIQVTNNGPADAPDVVVTDTLPLSVAYEIDNDNCDLVSQDPDVLECHLGTIGAGQTVSFDISALVDAGAPPGEITNTAVVSMPYDTNSDNNTASATNLVLEPIMADLQVAKSYECEGAPQNPNGCLAGTTVSFVLDVYNHGPLTADNVVLEDLLPEGVTVTGYQGWRNDVEWPAVSCNTGIPGDPDAPLTCGLGSMALDDHVRVTIYATIDPDYVHPTLPDDYRVMENDARVSSDLYDPDNDNNQTSAIFNVYTMSDVWLWKSGPDQAVAGEEISYHIRVRNLGPSTLTNFHFVDALPALEHDGEEPAVTYLGYEIEQGTGQCIYPWPMEGDNAVHCYLDDIAPGGVRVVHLRVLVNPDVPDGTYIHNEINGWFANSGQDVFGPMEVDTEISNEADLSVSKTATPWKVFAGEQVMYDVSVTNHGPANAYEVLVTDTLPSGVGFELSTDPDCYPVDGDVVCEWNMLSVGQSRSFQIFGRVDPDAEPGTVSNRVWVDSLTASDPVDYNDYASAPVLIQGRADLKVQKFGKPEGEVRAGDKLTYTVIVDNLGTGSAHEVTLDDLMKSDGSFDLMEVTSDRDALCQPQTGTFQHDLHLTCSLSDTLEVKGPTPGSGRWMLTVIVIANEPQDINNVAYVAGSDYDPDLSNNEAMAEHEITAMADLELTKEAQGEMLVGCEGETELWVNQVAAGGTVTYTLTVSNTGPSTAENVVVLDEPLPFPDLLEIDVQSIAPSQGNCQTAHIVDERRLSCNLGTILPEESANVTFIAHVPSSVADGTVLVNDAQVYSDRFDNNNGNDVVTNHTLVSRVADLQVEKTQQPEISLPGWDITYTITVTNLGLSDAEGVLISDTIPAQVLNPTWTCCASDGGECNIPCEPPTCPVEPCPWHDVGLFAQADIPAGEWVIYTVEGTLDWWPCGPFTNTVELIPPQSLVHPEVDIDPCDENNAAEAVNDPFCHFDPLVLKVYPGSDSPP